MAIPKPESPQEQPNPYLPPGPEPLICDQFMGINTQATRVGVDDKQMFWCSGYMPIAPHALRTLPGIGATLYTASVSSIVFYGFANIGATPICIVFLANGQVDQVNTITRAVTTILGPNTITNPSILTTGMCQWGSTYVLIINHQANGYFVWDGTNAFRAGTIGPIVTLTNVGSGYTSAPTVAVTGGTGSGIVLTAHISPTGTVTSVTVVDGGNYGNGSVAPIPSIGVTFTGGGGIGAAGTVNVIFDGTTPPGHWKIFSITMTNIGSGYVSAPAVTPFSPQEVSAATLTANVTTTSPVTSVTVTNPGSGYSVNDVLVVGFSGGGGSGAAATVTLMPFGLSGTSIETAFQRVWLVDGPLLQFGAPGSVSNFATSSGGASVVSNDPFLRVGYTRLIQSNGFLYLLGDSSMNYISGVQTSGSPPTTTYTNQNADPEVGTPYPATAMVYGRNLVFANSFGVHQSFGAAVTKVSADLDGVYNTVDNFGGQQLSTAKATIFGKKTWMMLLPLVDPVTGNTVNELVMWNGNKTWFSSKQDEVLTFINYQEINSVLTAWGTDGSSIFPLFDTPSILFTKTMQTKLWTKPGGYQFNKSDTRFWNLVQYFLDGAEGFNITIDSEYSAQPYAISPPDVGMIWTEEGITPMTWTTNGTTPMTWSLGPVGIRVFDPLAIGQQGVLNGWTASTNAADAAIISQMIQPEVVGYRG